jgi:diadenosine tetraphosphate (Ap4A) HIT family hydrolase
MQVDGLRGAVTFDPFDAAISADSATRAAMNERVLWEDDSVVVIVAQPPIPRDALVVPRREMMFPTDASESLLKQMALVAAATSDAFVATAGKRCDTALVSNIFVNAPASIGVKHLHVHVQPPAAIEIKNEGDFYSRMSLELKAALSRRSSAKDAIRSD